MILDLRPVRVTPPAVAVASIEDFAQLAGIDFSDDDALALQLIQAATDHLDGYAGILGRCMVNQTWRVDFADWSTCGYMRLPFPDVSAISSVAYFDGDNVETALATSNYQRLEDARGSLVRFVDGFASPTLYSDREDAVRVTFVAGYGAAASNVPMALRVAVMMLAAHWYWNRREMGKTPEAVTSLIAPYRRMGV